MIRSILIGLLLVPLTCVAICPCELEAERERLTEALELAQQRFDQEPSPTNLAELMDINEQLSELAES